jgi:hypothetical protein
MPKGEGPKGPTWKGSKPPDEVARLNQEARRSRPELNMAAKGEQNRKKLLEGIDPQLIKLGRDKADELLSLVGTDANIQSEKMIDDMVRSYHPKQMIAMLLGLDERSRQDDPIRYAAIAKALLALTHEA